MGIRTITPEGAGPPEQYSQSIHVQHDETGAGTTLELPRSPETEEDEAVIHIPGLHLYTADRRYIRLGCPVCNHSPCPESMGGAAVEDPSGGRAEVPEANSVGSTGGSGRKAKPDGHTYRQRQRGF